MARALGAPAGAAGGCTGPGQARRLQRPRRAPPLPRGHLRGPAGRGEVGRAGLQTAPFHPEKPDWSRGLPMAGPGGSLLWRPEGMETSPPKPSSPLPTGLLPQSPASSPPQEHSILLSIVALGRTLRGAVAGGRRGALEKAAWTVAVRTEAVMRRHCRTLRQRSRRPETRPVRRRGGRRRLLLRALDAVATCWEKLFALRAAATDGSWGS
ncbi:uncharacterized protein C20orf204 homolog isoform 1-T1 [Megaptera novaeangliae]